MKNENDSESDYKEGITCDSLNASIQLSSALLQEHKTYRRQAVMLFLITLLGLNILSVIF